jgi:hypothetical protein
MAERSRVALMGEPPCHLGARPQTKLAQDVLDVHLNRTSVMTSFSAMSRLLGPSAIKPVPVGELAVLPGEDHMSSIRAQICKDEVASFLKEHALQPPESALHPRYKQPAG